MMGCQSGLMERWELKEPYQTQALPGKASGPHTFESYSHHHEAQ
jgi:hypothetical protein